MTGVRIYFNAMFYVYVCDIYIRYDRWACSSLLEVVTAAQVATPTKVRTFPANKRKPLPLATVELQKCASRYLNINSKETMEIAESLYQQGFLSYPRTETDSFKEGFDLNTLIDEQRGDARWGAFATNLLDGGGFEHPRNGGSNDNAHPPIHPVKRAPPQVGAYLI